MLDLLVIQPTPFCNLDCDYCYLPLRQSRDRIGGDVLRRVFQRAFEFSKCGDHFSVVWHAGEPMVLPVLFYHEALEILAQCNMGRTDIAHSLQTNGTLITDEWCKFIRANNFRIGVSIDGPDFLNNRHRKTRSKRGTFSQVIAGIRRLNEHRIPFHVITVLTRESLDYSDELFEFYCEHHIRRIAFNIEEIEGINANSSLDYPEVRDRFAQFLGRFYDLVGQAAVHLTVREFDSAVTAIMFGGTQEVSFSQQTTPMAIISVDCYGNFSTFSPELLGLKSVDYGDFALGNVMRDSFDSVLWSPKFRAINDDIATGVQNCRNTCEYFPFCGGGAPANKYFENGTFRSTETMFCRLTKKTVLDVVLRKLEMSAAPQRTTPLP